MTAAGSVSSEPLYGWYGDDLTGATDTLAAIARRGQRAFLFLSVPSAQHLAAVGPLDAIGIAGAARTMNPGEMRRALPPIGRFFSERGIRLLHYKCCSTFDSAPQVGNLAAAIVALRPSVTNPIVPILGGQPSLGRYCAFSNLFATAGDRVHRIDRHPTMSRHPATPMHEADLVRHFESLGLPAVARIHWPSITSTDLDAAWGTAAAGSPPAVLFDVLDSTHLAVIGKLLRREAVARPTLVVGASSIAEAWFAPSAVESPKTDMGEGPVFALIGSLSPVTRSQVAAARSYLILQIRPEDICGSAAQRAAVADEAVAVLARGRNVMVSTAPLAGPAPEALVPGLAEASAALVDDVLRRSGVRRVAIAGGDTSTLATSALGFWGLAYHGLASRGTTVCRGRSDAASRDGMLLMLKGGQMGDEDVFDAFAGSAQDDTTIASPAPAL